MNCFLVFALAVAAVSAAPCSLNFNTVSTCRPALPGKIIYSQTPVVENPTSFIPSCIPQTSVSQSCHCFKTLVTPQIRNEVITVPQIDRIVRVVPSPVVEAVTVNLGGNTRTAQLPTCGLSSGVVDTVSVPRVVDGFCGSNILV